MIANHSGKNIGQIKNFYNLIMKKKEKPYTVTKWPKDLNRHFFKEDIQG